MRIFLLIVLAIATVWDGFTTVYGTLQALGDGPIQIGIAFLFSGLIFGFVLNTKRLMRWKGGFVSGVAKFFWVIALGYDLYTSWIGNSALVVRGNGSATKIIILIGLTLLVTASPILLSAMWQRGPSSQERQGTLSQSPEPSQTH